MNTSNKWDSVWLRHAAAIAALAACLSTFPLELDAESQVMELRVSGAVESVDFAKQSILVAGQQIVLGKLTRFYSDAAEDEGLETVLETIRTGDYISAYGDSKEITAVRRSRETYVPGATPIFVKGLLSSIDSILGRARIGNLILDFTPLLGDSNFRVPDEGREAAVTGIQPVAGGIVLLSGRAFVGGGQKSEYVVGSGASSDSVVGSGVTSASVDGSGARSVFMVGSGITGGSVVGSGARTNSVVGSGVTGASVVGSGARSNSVVGSGVTGASVVGSGARTNSVVGSGVTGASVVGSGARSNSVVGSGVTGASVVGSGARSNSVVGSGVTGASVVGSGARSNSVVGSGVTGASVVGSGARTN